MSNRSRSNKTTPFLFGFRLGTVLLVLWVFVSSGQAGVYTWKDKNGKIHFTDELYKIPKKYRNEKKGFKQFREPPPTPRSVSRSPSSSEFREGNAGGSVFKKQEYVIDVLSVAGGNLIVEAVLNRRVKARLMVDTGASLVTLSEGLARKLGLVSYSDRAAQIPFTTAGGVVWNPVVVLDQIRVGQAKAFQVEASVNSEMGELDGLLGMSFLGEFTLSVDQTSGFFSLSTRGHPGEPVWDGHPGPWWGYKFGYYARQISQYEKQAEMFRKLLHPKAQNVARMVDLYKDLHHKLEKRARRAQVPLKYRSSS